MSVRSAQILLGSIIAARATSMLFSKLLLTSMSPFNLLALRFGLAFVLLAALFAKRLIRIAKHDFVCGTIMGILFFCVMSCDNTALVYANTSTVGLLENSAVVFVPLAEALLCKRAPSRRTTTSALMALVGVALISCKGQGFSFGLGEAIALIGAFFYTCSMMYISRASQNGDAIAMGIVQVAWIGALSFGASLLTGNGLVLPCSSQEWLYLGALVVVCTGFGFTLQPLAQRPLSSEQASILCTINTIVATTLGVVVLHEELSIWGCIGLVLIISAIVLSVTKRRYASLPKVLAGRTIMSSTKMQNVVMPRLRG